MDARTPFGNCPMRRLWGIGCVQASGSLQQQSTCLCRSPRGDDTATRHRPFLDRRRQAGETALDAWLVKFMNLFPDVDKKRQRSTADLALEEG